MLKSEICSRKCRTECFRLPSIIRFLKSRRPVSTSWISAARIAASSNGCSSSGVCLDVRSSGLSFPSPTAAHPRVVIVARRIDFVFNGQLENHPHVSILLETVVRPTDKGAVNVSDISASTKPFFVLVHSPVRLGLSVTN